jgi:hypothetical protein
VIASPATKAPDPAAQSYAVLFARRYLTWRADSPSVSANALAPFLGASLEPAATPQLPREGQQTVSWAEAVQAGRGANGAQEYTVAAQTSTLGLVYLDVEVQRSRGGALELVGYPAFVGPPLSTAAGVSGGPEVGDQQLVTVVDRALRNYLSGAAADLSADLAPEARVSLPAAPLTLLTVQRVDWTRGRDSVLAVVTAQDQRGTQYALEYELGVEPLQGRWEIGAIQANEDA